MDRGTSIGKPAACGSRVGRTLLVIAGLLLGCPAVAVGQDLPTAGDLETGESTAEEGDSQTESTSEAESEETDEASSDEASSANSTSDAASEETSASKGDDASSDASPNDSGDTKTSDAKTSSTSADSKDDEGDDDKPGKLIETEESVEEEIEGAHSDAKHRRRVQEGVNLDGVPGFQDITSARPRKPMTFRISLRSDFTASSSFIRRRDQNRFFGGRINLQGTFLEYFSANIGFRARNNVNSYGRPRAMLALGDLNAGLRGHYSPKDGIDLGFDLTLDIPSGFQIAGPDFSGTSVRPRLLSTFDVGELADRDVPLDFHVNVGYRADNSSNLVSRGVRLTRVERFAHGISAYDYLEIGVGAQYDLPYVSPFLAWDLSIPVAGEEGVCDAERPLPCAGQVGFSSFPDKISFGLQGEPIEQLALHAGVDIGVTPDQAEGVPATPPYAVMLGASWTIDLDPRVKRITRRIEKTRLVERMPPRGRIDGKVVDADTGDPVEEARITYLSNPKRTPQMTDSGKGAFETYGFSPKTKIKMRVTHPNYHDKTVTRTISEGTQDLKVELNPKPRVATVRGKVVDNEGSPVTGATVKFNGPERATSQTDGSGAFSREVKPGDYTVSVSAPDYMTGGQDVSLKEREKTQLQISLQPAPDEDLATLKGDKIQIEGRVQFETGSAKLSQDSLDILDQVSTVLLKNPNIEQIEIQGHTDDTGTDEKNTKLSQKRAETVLEYLVDRGIAEDRLKAKGYGPSQPRVPNISPRNRRLNRRVEFKVLQK